ncbi:MAG TPA: cache domain-containing protein [Bryobacteraceae bacterium]|jgi:hypothetical protein
MPVDRLEVKVSITKLLLALIIVIVPLSIAGLILTERSVKSLDNSVGNDFKTIAAMYSNEVSQFIHEGISDIGALAQDPIIVGAVAAKPGAAKAEGTGKGLLTSSASQLLRQRKVMDPRLLSIIVTDDAGNLVAASQQPSKLSYAQDAIWQAAYNNGQPVVRISDILDDEFTKSSYVNASLPVKDAASGAPIGILNAAVSVSDLLARFRQAQVGNGARVELVNDNGMIVSAPNADVFAHVRSQQFDAVHDSLGSPQGIQFGWVMANLANGPWIVGFANTGLKQHFPNMGWIVMVSQEEQQAVAPIRTLVHFALTMVILAVLMLTLLFVYYYLHRTQKFTHIEEEETPAEKTRAATAF